MPPLLISQNKKVLIASLTLSLLVFSTLMLFFEDPNSATLDATKASIIHAEEATH
jgi:hypothetical protein